MVPEIIVREYQPGDDEGIIEALRASFPGWRRNPLALEYWRWKYLESPLGAYIAVCECGGKIVAVNHDLRLSLKVGNSSLLTHWTDDLSVLPEYRAHGLWNRMRKMRNEGSEYVNLRFKYSSTANPIVVKDWVKRGVNVFPHPVKYMIRVKDPKLHLDKRPVEGSQVVRLGISVLKGVNRVTPRGKIKRLGEFKLTDVDSFNEDVDAFWMKAREGYNFAVERSKEYLNWRFSEKPWGRVKRVLAVDGSGDVIGYTALGVSQYDDYHEGHISDLFALSGRVDVVHDLFKAACEHFDGLGINVAYYRCAKGHPYERIAGGSFVGVPRKSLYISYETLTANRKESEILSDSSSSEISLNYADTF